MRYRTQIRKLAKVAVRPTRNEVVKAVGAAADAVCSSNVIYRDSEDVLVWAGSNEDKRMVIALEEALRIVEAHYLMNTRPRPSRGIFKDIETFIGAKAKAQRKLSREPGGRNGSDWIEAYKSAHYAADLMDQVWAGKNPENILERLEHQANCLKGALYRLKRERKRAGGK